MNLPLISVIIPVFNSDRTLADTIKSVQNQTYSNWEAVLIDDGSSDNSINILISYAEKDTRINYFSRTSLPFGASACRNIGLEKAKGEYIIFLDSDDLLAPWCLQERIEIMQKLSYIDFGVFNMKYFKDYSDDKNQLVTNKTTVDPLADFLKHQLPWVISCPIWRRTFLLELGGFNAKYPRLNDPELHTRALLKSNNYKTFFDLKEDCYYRIGEKFEKPSYEFINKHFTSILYYMEDMPRFINDSVLINNKGIYISYLKTFLFKAVKSAVEWNKIRWAYKLLCNAKNANLINMKIFLKNVMYINIHYLSYKTGFYNLNILKSKFRI